VNAAAVAVALSAAVAFGWSTALMHHSASRAPKNDSGLLSLLWHLLFQPRWLAGMVASLAGLGLHALALKLGSLAVVQPLVVTGLVFAFLFRALLDWRLPSRTLIGWVLLTAFGSALFLIGARSVSSSSEPSGPTATVFLIVGATAAAIIWRSSTWFGRNHAGLLLGVSGGIVFGLIAGVLKAATGSAGLIDLLTHWPVYVLVSLGFSGFLINQHAYSRAPLASSLPILNVANPLIAVLFGVVVFHERPSGQPLTVVTEVIGLLTVLIGIFFLAQEEDQPPTLIAALAEVAPGTGSDSGSDVAAGPGVGMGANMFLPAPPLPGAGLMKGPPAARRGNFHDHVGPS
jgi:uncharacterized membrane protein